MDAIQKKFDERKSLIYLRTEEDARRTRGVRGREEQADRDKRHLRANWPKLQKDQLRRRAGEQTAKNDAFQFDEPQGKIRNRLAEGIVEIDIGSAASVKPGLTFTVLPSDFPEKGRQSRMRVFRIPDERGITRMSRGSWRRRRSKSSRC